MFLDAQGMLTFPDGKWSGSKQLICTHGKVGSFLEYEFDSLESRPYEVIVYGTKAPDYGVLGFSINGQKSNVEFDG